MITFPAGTIVKLKIPCLGNPIGALGVVFYDYGDGSVLRTNKIGS